MMKPMFITVRQQATRITTTEGVKAAADTLLKMWYQRDDHRHSLVSRLLGTRAVVAFSFLLVREVGGFLLVW
jgi:hypothetical protein